MYSAVLRVCTSAGCSDSNASLQRTSEGVPSGVPAPSLTALSTESIEARWTAPSSPNGIVLQYELLVETGGISTIVFAGNATDFRVVIDSLLPHTTYTFRLRASTSAGLSTGPASSVRTLQDVPTGVQAPTVVTTARTATLSWTLPSMPNGVITRYSIRRDGSQLAVNLSSVTLTYTDTGLLPFTIYNYAVVACTSLGCSVGNESAAQTLEDIPEGVNGPVLRVVDEKTVEASWTAPTRPNGNVQYDLFVFGAFEAAGTIVNESRLVLSASSLFSVNVTGLLPFSRYAAIVTASTSAGSANSSLSNFVTTAEAGENGLEDKKSKTVFEG